MIDKLTPTEFATLVQAAASILAFIAALIAVWVTYKATDRAANFQRRHNEEIERRREQYQILKTLMNYRGVNISHPEAVSALNMIVILFQDNQAVLDEWNEFLRYVDGASHHQKRFEGYMRITVEIAKALGFSKSLSVAAIDRGYFPLSNSPILSGASGWQQAVKPAQP